MRLRSEKLLESSGSKASSRRVALRFSFATFTLSRPTTVGFIRVAACLAVYRKATRQTSVGNREISSQEKPDDHYRHRHPS